VKWAFGDAKAWTANSLDELEEPSAISASEEAASTVDPVTSFVRAVFDTAAGDMRARSAKLGSKTMDDVLDHFAGIAGEGRATKETFHGCARLRQQEPRGAAPLMGDMVNDRERMKQVANLVRNPTGSSRARRSTTRRRHPQDARRAR
jgi:hypothetical protein